MQRYQNRAASPFTTFASFRVRREGVMGRRSRNEVALGIFIAWENFFEQEGQGADPLAGPISTFSEEDLVSDLIGFHVGRRQVDYGEDENIAFEHFMDACDVVGYDYYKAGKRGNRASKEVFKSIQATIYSEYLRENGSNPFGKHHLWGCRPSRRWSGEVSVTQGSSIESNPNISPLLSDLYCCSYTFSCDKQQEHLPAELISVTPQFPGRNWIWESGRLEQKNQIVDQICLPGAGCIPVFGTRVTNFDAHRLNDRPLNWAPTGQ